MRTAELAPMAFKAETPAPITLPDGQIFVTSGDNSKFLTLLTESPNGTNGNIPIVPIEEVDKLYDGSKRRKQRSLTDWRQSTLDNGRQTLKPRGWGITRTKQRGKDFKLHEIVFLVKIGDQEENSQRNDKVSEKKNQPKNSKSKSPSFDPEDAADFFRKLREQLPDLHNKDNGSVPTSSPAPESPKDKDHF